MHGEWYSLPSNYLFPLTSCRLALGWEGGLSHVFCFIILLPLSFLFILLPLCPQSSFLTLGSLFSNSQPITPCLLLLISFRVWNVLHHRSPDLGITNLVARARGPRLSVYRLRTIHFLIWGLGLGLHCFFFFFFLRLYDSPLQILSSGRHNCFSFCLTAVQTKVYSFGKRLHVMWKHSPLAENGLKRTRWSGKLPSVSPYLRHHSTSCVSNSL